MQANAQETNTPVPQMEEYWDWQIEHELKLQERLDDPEITDAARQFAKKHNCKLLYKDHFWSRHFFRGNGSVYYCGQYKKCKYILEHNNKLRFERWYERRTFRKERYE